MTPYTKDVIGFRVFCKYPRLGEVLGPSFVKKMKMNSKVRMNKSTGKKEETKLIFSCKLY
jgi:hypothetical protein